MVDSLKKYSDKSSLLLCDFVTLEAAKNSSQYHTLKAVLFCLGFTIV